MAYPERAYCKINVGGQDVTDNFRPHLIIVHVIDKISEMPRCSIELDDADGSIRLPADFEPITIQLGWADSDYMTVFEGQVNQLESHFTRKSGRRLTVHGTGTPLTGKAKVPMQLSMGDGLSEDITLEQFLQKAAQKAGFSITVAPQLANIKRKWWGATTQSFMDLGHRLGNELGGAFKIDGKNASLTPLTGFTNATGQALATVTAAWGMNLISWRIFPFVGRPLFQGASAQWFDFRNGKWVQESDQIGQGDYALYDRSADQWLSRLAAAGKDIASQMNQGAGAHSSLNRGYGTVVMDGEAKAQAGGKFVLTGARPGVDGIYKITEAEQIYGRSGGFLTRCDVMLPQGTVGQDSR